MDPLILLFITVLGLEVGSFANVCIYRWPRDSSILSPRRSRCPSCKRTIPWHDNIPVLSFFLLKGRCRHCAKPISGRYPFVEVLVPCLWLGYFLPFRHLFYAHPFFTGLVFYLLLIVVITTFTDLDWKIIPDEASYSLAVLGLALSPWNPFFAFEPAVGGRLLQSLYGGLAGGGMLLLVAQVGKFIFKREAMGGGDIKLLAAFGTVLGYEGAILTFMIGSIVGGMIALPLLIWGRLKRHSYLPYGPFLNIGALGTLFSLLKKIS